MLVTVQIDKLVHGGQGLGLLPDGRKIFVWNALPGETVGVRIIKSKHSYAEGIAEEIILASPDRIEPKEENYLATSPWQIMSFAAENKNKHEIVQEVFTQAGVLLPKLDSHKIPVPIGLSDGSEPVLAEVEVAKATSKEDRAGVARQNDLGVRGALRESSKFQVTAGTSEYNYRNKMEYSFWGDDDGLHLALHSRGSHQKQIVTGSALAMPAIDRGAKSILKCLPASTRAGDLKTIIVRCSQDNQTVASLFVKRQDFYKLTLPKELKGLRVYYSNPKSPASVRTELLYELGNCTLSDRFQGQALETVKYDVDSFFQVNVPVFELALQRMGGFVGEDSITDMYSGVGSIGLCLAKKSVDLVELDSATSAMARINAAASSLDVQVIEASTEKALEYITADRPVIFDPPRAGLHDKVVARVLEVMPPKIIYLSCNPSTHARDIAKLLPAYKIVHFEVYNFFPRTPHIETLVIMERL